MRDPFATGVSGPFQTDASAALRPYVARAQVEQRGQASLLQPVKLIFDILQRGQYLTANVAEEIIRSVRTGETLSSATRDAISGALEGLSGRRKGDWQNVLFGGQSEGDEEFSGLFPDSTLPLWAKKAIGFAANVALDPTTYVSFGATKGAIAGAQKYAKDSMELFIKTLTPDTLQKAMTKGFDVSKAQKLASESADKAAEYISKFKGDLGRSASDVYKKAYKEALRTPSAQLTERMTGRVQGATQPFLERYKATKNVKKQAQALQGLGGLQDIGSRATTGYGMTGERALKLGPLGMGQEIGASVRNPAHVQAWDKISAQFAASPVGSKISDAWYAINSRLLGGVRKVFGVRNPFESYVHNIAQDAIETRRAETGVLWKEVNDVVNKIPDDLVGPAQSALRLAEHLNVRGGTKIGGEMAVKDPAFIQQAMAGLKGNDKLVAEELFANVHGQDVPALTEAIQSIKALTDAYAKTAHEAVSRGIITDFGERLAYLPNVTVDTMGGLKKGAAKGSETPAFTRQRSYTQTERIGQETSYVEWLFGLTPEQASKLVKEKNIGNLATDLKQMLLYRAEGEARLKARMGLVEDIKKLGIPVPEAQKALQLKLMRGTDAFRPVAGKAFDGLLFPTEVADALEKVSTSSADPGMKSVKGMWNWFTSWWKGFVTMTTGFHARNFVQNNVTGFLHHGVQWFDPREGLDGLVGAIHALAKDNPKPLLEQFAIKQDVYLRTLKKRVGNFSIEELADYGYYKGLVSKTTQAFDAQSFGQTAGPNLNPMSRSFAGAQASRNLGNIIENQAKMQSFLMDYKQAIKHSPEERVTRLGETLPFEQVKNLPQYKEAEYALEYAKNESKKWFFDYQDLTDTEKNVFRQIIPFYSWLRKNIPAQLATIWTNPSIYSLFPKGQAAIAMPGVDEELIPDWMKQLGAIPVSKDETGKPIFWSPNMAYLDLNKIPFLAKKEGGVQIPLHEVLMDVMAAAHPAIKSAVQMIPEKGYDIFQRKDLDYKAPAPYILGFFTKAPKVLEFMDGVARTFGWDLGFSMKDEKLVMDAKMAKLLEDNLPILRSFERTVSLAEGTIPGLEDAIQAATGAKTKYDGMQKFFQTLSFWAGAKFNLVDLEKEKARIRKDVLDAAQQAKSRAEAGSPLAQRRSLAYQKGRETLMRKVGI